MNQFGNILLRSDLLLAGTTTFSHRYSPTGLKYQSNFYKGLKMTDISVSCNLTSSATTMQTVNNFFIAFNLLAQDGTILNVAQSGVYDPVIAPIFRFEGTNTFNLDSSRPTLNFKDVINPANIWGIEVGGMGANFDAIPVDMRIDFRLYLSYSF